MEITALAVSLVLMYIVPRLLHLLFMKWRKTWKQHLES